MALVLAIVQHLIDDANNGDGKIDSDEKIVSQKTRMEVKEDDAEENQGHSDEDGYDSDLDTCLRVLS